MKNILMYNVKLPGGQEPPGLHSQWGGEDQNLPTSILKVGTHPIDLALALPSTTSLATIPVGRGR